MVFVVQKGGFYIAKVWFLFFECCVVAIRQQHYWQAVSSRRGPIYRARVSEYTHKMTNGNTCAVKWIHVYNNVEMRIR